MKAGGKYSIMWVFEFLVISVITVSTITFLRNNIYASHSAVVHTEKMIKTLDKINTGMLNAETGQRGYIITDREEYLQPYQTAYLHLNDDLTELESLVQGNGWKETKYNQLNALIKAKLSELDRSMRLRKVSFALCQLAVNQDIGKHLMDEIRKVIIEMNENENTILMKRHKEEVNSLNLMMIVLPFVSFANFILLVLVHYSIREKEKGEVDKFMQVRSQAITGQT